MRRYLLPTLLAAMALLPGLAEAGGKVPRDFQRLILRRSRDLEDPQVKNALAVLVEKGALRGVLHDWEVYQEGLESAGAPQAPRASQGDYPPPTSFQFSGPEPGSWEAPELARLRPLVEAALSPMPEYSSYDVLVGLPEVPRRYRLSGKPVVRMYVFRRRGMGNWNTARILDLNTETGEVVAFRRRGALERSMGTAELAFKRLAGTALDGAIKALDAVSGGN